MQFHSTLNPNKCYDFIHAIDTGLAPDGGLYVPEKFPTVNLAEFDANQSYTEFACRLLNYFIDKPLKEQLPTLCQQAFNFPVTLNQVNDNTWLLELFHGPTLSFKDFGARFLAQCLSHINIEKPVTVLVATSGDTGSAVASAFYQKHPMHVIVLFPKGKVSHRQQQQITCWGDNILAIEVDGTFDDCQRLVKATFKHDWWQQNMQLSTANSINIGRLLPQVIYYAYTSIQFQQQHQTQAGFIVPSGNLGNVTAAYWAKKIGFPIRDIVIATNANRPLTQYLETGHFKALDTQTTLANAMDVGNPSNFARLHYLYPEYQQFKSAVTAYKVEDPQITDAIHHAYTKHNLLICPHTATAYHVRQQLGQQPWIIASTAHPCKFNDALEPIIHKEVPPTDELTALLKRPHHYQNIKPTLDALTKITKDFFDAEKN